MASGRAQTEFVEHTASLGGQPPRARRVDPSPPLNLSPNPCPRAHLRIVLSPWEGDEPANRVVILSEPCRTNWRGAEWNRTIVACISLAALVPSLTTSAPTRIPRGGWSSRNRSPCTA